MTTKSSKITVPDSCTQYNRFITLNNSVREGEEVRERRERKDLQSTIKRELTERRENNPHCYPKKKANRFG